MAYTAHWPNTYATYYTIKTPAKGKPFDTYFNAYTTYRNKIGYLSPVNNVQEDILFPNAMEAVRRAVQGHEENVSSLTSMAVGCKGHQLDNDFPLEPRVPVLLPLIQYPTNTRGPDLHECDMCAVPILNWETYVRNFCESGRLVLGNIAPKNKYRFRGRRKRSPLPQNKQESAGTSSSSNINYQRSEEWEETESSSEEKETQSATSSDDEEEKLETLTKYNRHGLNVEGAARESNSKSQPSSSLPKKCLDNAARLVSVDSNGCKENYLNKRVPGRAKKYPDFQPVIAKPKRHTLSEASRVLLSNPVDIDEDEKEKELVKRKKGRHKSKMSIEMHAKQKKSKRQFNLTKRKRPSKQKVPLDVLRSYKDQPALRVMGSWNFLYSGHGACDWAFEYADKKRKNMYIGNGTKLRMISLKPSLPDKNKLLSYYVDSVWEEETVPSNAHKETPKPDDILGDTIFEIRTHKKRNIIAARRGRSIEIYEQEGGVPSLLCSIPNILYGTTKYIGSSTMSISSPVVKNPLLLSCDLNSYSPSELVTMDENKIIQFLDFVAEKSVVQLKANKEVIKLKLHRSINKYPRLELNESAGVSYTGNNPEVIYYYFNSQIFLHDRRVYPMQIDEVPSHELLNLRNSVSSLTWSDQLYFTRPEEHILNEWISCLKPSKNDNYYYVGTTSRVLLMDVRVPKNPVCKFNHGMRSAAAYLDVISNDNYETLVGASQRDSQFFSATFDTTHIACVDRLECKQRNPILQSHPRHLLTSSDFFDYTVENCYGFAWESDYQRVKDHCNAWTTGLCLMKSTQSFDSRKPTPFILFDGNSFGDLYCQEWDQTPLRPSRKVEHKDERLHNFMTDWSRFMESKSEDDLKHFPDSAETFDPEPFDFSLVMHTAGDNLKCSNRIRTKPFDPFKPRTLRHNRVTDGLPKIDEQIEKLRPIRSTRVLEFLRQWTSNVELDDEEVTLDNDRISESSDSNDSAGEVTNIPTPGPSTAASSSSQASKHKNSTARETEEGIRHMTISDSDVIPHNTEDGYSSEGYEDAVDATQNMANFKYKRVSLGELIIPDDEKAPEFSNDQVQDAIANQLNEEAAETDYEPVSDPEANAGEEDQQDGRAMYRMWLSQ